MIPSSGQVLGFGSISGLASRSEALENVRRYVQTGVSALVEGGNDTLGQGYCSGWEAGSAWSWHTVEVLEGTLDGQGAFFTPEWEYCVASAMRLGKFLKRAHRAYVQAHVQRSGRCNFPEALPEPVLQLWVEGLARLKAVDASSGCRWLWVWLSGHDMADAHYASECMSDSVRLSCQSHSDSAYAAGGLYALNPHAFGMVAGYFQTLGADGWETATRYEARCLAWWDGSRMTVDTEKWYCSGVLPVGAQRAAKTDFMGLVQRLGWGTDKGNFDAFPVRIPTSEHSGWGYWDSFDICLAGENFDTDSKAMILAGHGVVVPFGDFDDLLLEGLVQTYRTTSGDLRLVGGLTVSLRHGYVDVSSLVSTHMDYDTERLADALRTCSRRAYEAGAYGLADYLSDELRALEENSVEFPNATFAWASVRF